MIGAIIMWVVALVLLILSALWFEVIGEEIAKGQKIRAKRGRFLAIALAVLAIALIVVAVRT